MNIIKALEVGVYNVNQLCLTHGFIGVFFYSWRKRVVTFLFGKEKAILSRSYQRQKVKSSS